MVILTLAPLIIQEKTTQNMAPERDNSFRNGITAGNFDAFVKLLKQAVDELTNGTSYPYLILFKT